MVHQIGKLTSDEYDTRKISVLIGTLLLQRLFTSIRLTG